MAILVTKIPCYFVILSRVIPQRPATSGIVAIRDERYRCITYPLIILYSEDLYHQ